MIKRKIIKKLFISTAALFTLVVLMFVPNKSYELNPNTDIQYASESIKKNNIYLLNDKNMLGRTSVVVNYDDTVDRTYELLDILISGGSGESSIPSGFRSILPSDTSIISVDFNNGILKVNFSEEVLDINKDEEEKMIEAIVYSLTEIEDVDAVSIYVEGEPLLRLPKTNTSLPVYLDRKIGINKEYDLTSLNNINQVTIYYIDKNNDDYYYVPVTKFVNDDREKISIIIDDLTSSKVYNMDLMSFLNSNTELLKVQNENNIMELTFNNYILNDFDKKDILEEVIYTICLSIKDNYDVKEVDFNVNDEKIYKSVLKSIE